MSKQKENSTNNKPKMSTYKKAIISGVLYSSMLLSCATPASKANATQNEPEPIEELKYLVNTEEGYFELWNHYASLLNNYNDKAERYAILSFIKEYGGLETLDENSIETITESMIKTSQMMDKNDYAMQMFSYRNNEFIFNALTPEDFDKENLSNNIEDLGKDIYKLNYNINLFDDLLEEKDFKHLNSHYSKHLVKQLDKYRKISPLTNEYFSMIQEDIKEDGYDFYAENNKLSLPILEEPKKEQEQTNEK